jgi:hypothetical protein
MKENVLNKQSLINIIITPFQNVYHESISDNSDLKYGSELKYRRKWAEQSIYF